MFSFGLLICVLLIRGEEKLINAKNLKIIKRTDTDIPFP